MFGKEKVCNLQQAPSTSISSSVTKENDATEISSEITTFQSGTTNTIYSHSAEKSMIIVKGSRILIFSGIEYQIKQSNSPFITPRIHH